LAAFDDLKLTLFPQLFTPRALPHFKNYLGPEEKGCNQILRGFRIGSIPH